MSAGAPRLRRGVRLSYDEVRQAHVLLFPEGVLVPNPTAAAVLQLCDGEASVHDIAERLGERYAEVPEADVQSVLDRLAERRVVEWT